MHTHKKTPAEQLAYFFTAELKITNKEENLIDLHMESLISEATPQGTQIKVFGTEKVIEELFEINGYWITRTIEPNQDGTRKISYQLIPE